MLRLAHGISLILLATATAPATATSADGGVAEAARACKPGIHLLSPLEGDTDSRLTAMNTRGWAVGTSWPDDPVTGGRYSSVLWRAGATVDLQTGGAHGLDSEPMDINRRGVVAVQRYGTRRGGLSIPATSWLWRDGTMIRLRGGQSRQHVSVEALNDHGVAAGSARGDSGTLTKPLLWRQGKRESLPVPSGASGWAVDINNHGLVVGNVHLRGMGAYESSPWYWRSSGKSGPLPLPAGEDLKITDVDNRGRILGSNGYEMGPRAFLWSGPTHWPRYLGRGRATAVALSEHGDLTGSEGGGRGSSARAWTGHVSDTQSATLPDPPTTAVWENTFGVAVIREVTSFAPQGGVSIGGTSDASPEAGFDRATIWTCTETY